MESSKYRLKHKNLPSAWLAPETMFLRQYSHKSDVWSFAIVLWEVYSLGDIPYRGMTHDEIEIEVRNLKLLEKPPDCPGAVFNLMLSSWNLSCKDRPTFRQLRNCLALVVNDLSKEYNGHRTSYLATDQPLYFTLSQSS
ncbi:Fibroblast growth factor receptor 4 [Holothuria leucospilota]|uniref:Fibroblast growth factor receptor 4 n=1 Tax=Holothuria leucospilota TaxID=206669 RepID=A0A9Q1BJB7_HOLLE|nr:Fibroblast growth factor receptor 4 [Holothuria leucospilota]